MSFEAAWGFDPEKVLRAQRLFQRVSEDAISAKVEEVGTTELITIDPQDAKIPRGAASQIYELRRMFRI
jgi:hypothetical protein